MTDATALASAIAMLERGETGREVDWVVGEALHPWLLGCERLSIGSWQRPQRGLVRLADYTTSIDAAVTLVPEPFSWEARHSQFSGCAQATLWDPRRAPGNGNEMRVSLDRGKPAAALTLACLRARLAMLEDGA